MRTYNLTEASALLGISPATLRRWRASVGGVGARGPADRRRAWLTRADLAELARAHGRVLVDAALGGGGGDLAELAREVAELRARVAALEEKEDRPGT